MHPGSKFKNGCVIYRSAEPESTLNIDGCADDLKYLTIMAR